MTTEKALAHFDAVNLEDFQAGGNLHLAVIPQAAVPVTQQDPAIIVKICGIYHTIRPYLQLVAVFPFVPAKVKQVISAAITQLDKLCPGT